MTDEFAVAVVESACNDATPSEESFITWVSAALDASHQARVVSIRLVDEDESQALNSQYRGKDKPTNVLSFPSDLPDFIDDPLLGDLAICAKVVIREALEQGKAVDAHWAHMTVHGTLHLQGYDHINDADAEEMENLEIAILAKLGYPNPYELATD